MLRPILGAVCVSGFCLSDIGRGLALESRSWRWRDKRLAAFDIASADAVAVTVTAAKTRRFLPNGGHIARVATRCDERGTCVAPQRRRLRVGVLWLWHRRPRFDSAVAETAATTAKAAVGGPAATGRSVGDTITDRQGPVPLSACSAQ